MSETTADWRENILTDDAKIRDLLRATKRVAVLGIKTEAQEDQAAFYVAKFLAGEGVEVDGEITIKGITKPIEATGTWTAPAADAFGNSRGHLNLEAVIDRTEWDMDWNMPLPSGGNVLANDVTLTVEISLVEQQQA